MSKSEEKKTTKQKKPVLEIEEVEAMVNEIVTGVNKLSSFFTGQRKKSLKLPDGSPTKGEYNSFTKRLNLLVSLYKKLYKLKPVKKKKPKKEGEEPKTGGNRGFKQERFLLPDAVTFVNSHADLPDNLKLKPLPNTGGFSIWNIAQATQVFGWYTDQNNLKNPEKRSEVCLNEPLLKLFQPRMQDLKKSQTWVKDGKTWITHSTLQHLVPRLFQAHLPVLPSFIDAETTTAMLKREEILKKRTEDGKIKREADAKAKKDAAKGK